jgi:hypothetical protein
MVADHQKGEGCKEGKYWLDILRLHAGCADVKNLNYSLKVIGVIPTNVALNGVLMLRVSMGRGELERYLITGYNYEKNKKQRESMGY